MTITRISNARTISIGYFPPALFNCLSVFVNDTFPQRKGLSCFPLRSDDVTRLAASRRKSGNIVPERKVGNKTYQTCSPY